MYLFRIHKNYNEFKTITIIASSLNEAENKAKIRAELYGMKVYNLIK